MEAERLMDEFTFKILVDKNPLVNHSYKVFDAKGEVRGTTFRTDENGTLKLKAGQTAYLYDIKGANYELAEINVDKKHYEAMTEAIKGTFDDDLVKAEFINKRITEIPPLPPIEPVNPPTPPIPTPNNPININEPKVPKTGYEDMNTAYVILMLGAVVLGAIYIAKSKKRD